jgi:hypothetical protein
VEQRRLRLGDILDDYCPRERRVTNHAIVAMIEDEIKQTRCTTCDAEHAYKGAKVPRRRKKESPAQLASAPAAPAATLDEDAVEPPPATDDAAATNQVEEAFEPQPVVAAAEEPPAAESADASAPEDTTTVEDGPAHRPLIRATLPRPEGQKTERPLPEFTVRHAAGRGGNAPFRGNGRPKARPHGGGNGARPHGRFAGARPGHGRGQPHGPHTGFRAGQPRHGGKKRSR